MVRNYTLTPPDGSGISQDTWNLVLNGTLKNGCPVHDLLPGVKNSYDYQPSFPAGIVFCVIFGLILIGHLVQTARFRRASSILLAIGALTEVIGWAGRTLNAKCPYNNNGFMIQIVTLIIAPTFFSASLYIFLGVLIRILGRKSSLLSARMYAIIFCTADVVSLVVQAVGGAMASTAANKVDGDTKPGTNIMVAGIVFQMFTLSIFAVLVVDFMRRVKKLSFPKEYRFVLVSVIISLTAIYVRSIYRTIELAQGWSGYLITHEGFFIGLDAATMVIAAGIFLIWDPAAIIPKNAQVVQEPQADKPYSPETSDGYRMAQYN